MEAKGASANLTRKSEMKPIKTLLLASALTGLMSFAHAGHWDHGRHHRARVTDVVPVYKTKQVPQEVCHSVYRERRRHDHRHDYRRDERRRHSRAGALIGGIAGGIIGHQVGRGEGQIATTAVGAAIGAVLGSRIEKGHVRHAGYRDRGHKKTRCHVEYRSEERLVGYRVSYRHRGHEHTRFMRERPGRWVELSKRDRREDRRWRRERRRDEYRRW